MCIFLLGDDAEAKHLIQKYDNKELDDLCRKIIEKARDLFFEESNENLFLFDGINSCNQCHLNACMIVLLAQQKSFRVNLSKTKEINDILHLDTGNQKETNLFKNKIRFLSLNFFLNSSMRNERHKALEKTLDLKFSGKLHSSLKSASSELINKAKTCLAQFTRVFFNHSLAKFIPQNKNTSLEQSGQFTWEKLSFIKKFNNKTFKISTLPKFIGIWCLLAFLEKEKSIFTFIRFRLKNKELLQLLIEPNQQDVKIIKNFPQDFLNTGCNVNSPIILIDAYTKKEDPINLATMDARFMQLCIASEWMKKNQAEFTFALLPESLINDLLTYYQYTQKEKLGDETVIEHMYPSTPATEIKQGDDLLGNGWNFLK
jgi:hypothetical protein